MPASLHRLAALSFVVACALPPTTQPSAPSLPPPAQRPFGEPTRILSAHAQPLLPGQRDYFGVPIGTILYLVFSRPLDPTGLAPGRFVTVADNGTRRVPIAARLAPASEKDELRALELLIPAPERTLLSVTVIGQLFDAGGRDMEGLSADVTPKGTPAIPVAAEPISADAACNGPALRVWWSVPVAAGEGPVRLILRDGQVSAPHARGDLACPPLVRLLAEGPACDIEDDNVLDYCLTPTNQPVARIELDPGAARDRQGVLSRGGALDLPP